MQAVIAANGMRRFGSSDNLSGLGPEVHQRSGALIQTPSEDSTLRITAPDSACPQRDAYQTVFSGGLHTFSRVECRCSVNVVSVSSTKSS